MSARIPPERQDARDTKTRDPAAHRFDTEPLVRVSQQRPETNFATLDIFARSSRVDPGQSGATADHDGLVVPEPIQRVAFEQSLPLVTPDTREGAARRERDEAQDGFVPMGGEFAGISYRAMDEQAFDEYQATVQANGLYGVATHLSEGAHPTGGHFYLAARGSVSQCR